MQKGSRLVHGAILTESLSPVFGIEMPSFKKVGISSLHTRQRRAVDFGMIIAATKIPDKVRQI